MGQSCSRRKVYYVMYLQIGETTIPLEWRTLEHLRTEMRRLDLDDSYPITIEDANEETFSIVSTSSFNALVPKHEELSGNRDVFYVKVIARSK